MPDFVSVPPDAAGLSLSVYLARTGHFLSAPCGGRGTCGKCRVTVLSGGFSDAEGKPLPPDKDGTVRACRAFCTPDGAAILLPDNAMTVTPDETPPQKGDFAALDLGTTTLCAARVHPDGSAVRTVSVLNPEQIFGADVISRISACRDGHLAELHASLLSAVRAMIGVLFPEGGGDVPMTVAGNTTMLHLFAGVSPEGMGHAPFLPAFTDTRTVMGNDLGLPSGEVTLLPSVSAFVGGDVTAGMLLLDMDLPSPTPRLLLDLGTNGEMVLATTDGELFCTSTAAGPALEGVNISYGMGGVSGAVSSVSVRLPEHSLCFETVGDAPAAGLCGSGLLDLAACLLDLGELNADGSLDGDFPLSGIHKTASGDRAVQTPVVLTQKDVRELQLAKSAIRAGLIALLYAAGMTEAEFACQGGTVYLAGGFGTYLSPRSAVRIGLLPPAFRHVVALGNTALSGAAKALSFPDGFARLAAMAKRCRSVDLNASPVFAEQFIVQMQFPEA